MSDQFDRASELEQRYRDDALATQQRKSHQSEQAYEQGGVRYCLGCHCAMSTARLVANPQAVRCVPCQQQHE
ncbi:TraR/DksA C4-type zinc finger protein [Shewanella eurypsychrophilus]|uniref:TraR/DksA C4-type zinc finger protein n=1 Tax=Shewanella eurypsychrophilus TaxID=2593656 RepID=A0ABX6V8K0_9GAMM|nr:MULTISPECIES: TraR/DksA C4-type zinc finger protein [Shewanella]QFU23747.1 TraR/DksA family transcriptional regulator [Shewanella sp. YLB-09]QPG58970.1 TraR/DksA C4-type zinc finger protein [Shewanella eurypsychrophilus]